MDYEWFGLLTLNPYICFRNDLAILKWWKNKRKLMCKLEFVRIWLEGQHGEFWSFHGLIEEPHKWVWHHILTQNHTVMSLWVFSTNIAFNHSCSYFQCETSLSTYTCTTIVHHPQRNTTPNRTVDYDITLVRIWGALTSGDLFP